MSEVFYVRGPEGYSHIVNVIHTCMLTDVMTVEYHGKEYSLKYNYSNGYYEGSVEDKEGYIVQLTQALSGVPSGMLGRATPLYFFFFAFPCKYRKEKYLTLMKRHGLVTHVISGYPMTSGREIS